MKKKIVILGSTGSVGLSVLDVAGHHGDRFEVVGLAAARNVDGLAAQLAAHSRARYALGDAAALAQLLRKDASLGSRSAGSGTDALTALIDQTEPDMVVNCLVGFVGLQPTLHALEAGIDVALANKESVVTGGELLEQACERSGARLIPIDSEHVAIAQCLHCTDVKDVRTVTITASGGSLRDHPLDDLRHVPCRQVLAHPTWDMGAKITVDSATLMNKGLEVIEAHWLFGFPFDRIRVVIHPQSIVHCLVELVDNSILAQLAEPDMRLPVLYALSYPDRTPTDIARSSITDFPPLTFRNVEATRYPCFDLAMKAAVAGGTTPTVLNSANETAVGAFLAENVSFGQIYDIIDAALDHLPGGALSCYDDVFETDQRTRAYIHEKFAIPGLNMRFKC